MTYNLVQLSCQTIYKSASHLEGKANRSDCVCTHTSGTDSRSQSSAQIGSDPKQLHMAATPPSFRPPAGAPGSTVYRMHVSQKYLDLTKKKLELTRLPRDSRSSRYPSISKAELDHLVDHWTDEYSWRAQENFYNDRLPQYRMPIHGTRIHFVHRQSMSVNAMPLLFIHGWPETFIAVSNMIDALCDPVRTPPKGDEDSPAFHVVAPSIPGFGFSDQVSEDGNNLVTTAEIFDSLMQSLGYGRYLMHGSGWSVASGLCHVQ